MKSQEESERILILRDVVALGRGASPEKCRDQLRGIRKDIRFYHASLVLCSE